MEMLLINIVNINITQINGNEGEDTMKLAINFLFLFR